VEQSPSRTMTTWQFRRTRKTLICCWWLRRLVTFA